MRCAQLKEFPKGTTLEGMRRAVGRFGSSGKAQTQPILQLSDGLRSRLVFAWLAYKTPHILALVRLPQSPRNPLCSFSTTPQLGALGEDC